MRAKRACRLLEDVKWRSPAAREANSANCREIYPKTLAGLTHDLFSQNHSAGGPPELLADQMSKKFPLPKPREALTPRDYQLAACETAASCSAGGRSLIVLPTGSGKSLVAAMIAKRLGDFYGSLIIVPSRELILQNYLALISQFPGLRVTINCAALGHRDMTGACVIATPMSLLSDDSRGFDAVIVDECHRIPEHQDSALKRIIAAARERNSLTKFIGLTATPFRMRSRLDDGSFFDKIDYEVTFLELLKRGLVVPLVGPSDSRIMRLDTSKIRTTAGDFNLGDMAQAFNQNSINMRIAANVAHHAAKNNLKSILAFAVSQEHARDLCAALRTVRIDTEFITDKTPADSREEIISRFKRGELRCLVNVAILKEGFDAPNVDCLVIARATQSVTLHIQFLGRGVRPSPGKEKCLVLDYAGNTERLGPISAPVLPIGSKVSGPAKARECPECHAWSAARAKICENCGIEFLREERKSSLDNLNIKPSQADPTHSDKPRLPPNVFKVKSVSYRPYLSRSENNNPPGLMAVYRLENGARPSEAEWINAWHGGPWGADAQKKWLDRLKPGKSQKLPSDAYDAAAIAHDWLIMPEFIQVKITAKGFRAVSPWQKKNREFG